jgi:putative oxidoreductase
MKSLKIYICPVIEFLLILLWIYAALSKLLSFDEFKGQMYNQTFSRGISGLLIYFLPPLELTAAVLLILNRTRMAGLVLSLVLMASFTVYISLVLLNFWSRVPCSCGGIFQKMGWKPHLWINLFFLALITIAINSKIKERSLCDNRTIA